MSNMQEPPGGFNFSQGARHRSTWLHIADHDLETIALGNLATNVGGVVEGFLVLELPESQRERGGGNGISEEGNKIGKSGK